MKRLSIVRPHWSHSSLRQLQTCGLQFKLKRIDKVAPSHRSPALVLGSVYHDVIAHALLALCEDRIVEQEALLEKFDELWAVELSIPAPPIRWSTRSTEESQRELGNAMIAAWHKQGLPLFQQTRHL